MAVVESQYFAFNMRQCETCQEAGTNLDLALFTKDLGTDSIAKVAFKLCLQHRYSDCEDACILIQVKLEAETIQTSQWREAYCWVQTQRECHLVSYSQEHSPPGARDNVKCIADQEAEVIYTHNHINHMENSSFEAREALQHCVITGQCSETKLDLTLLSLVVFGLIHMTAFSVSSLTKSWSFW